jgi:hypothetical protein
VAPVVLYVATNVSEERNDSIFNLEDGDEILVTNVGDNVQDYRA